MNVFEDVQEFLFGLEEATLSVLADGHERQRLVPLLDHQFVGVLLQGVADDGAVFDLRVGVLLVLDNLEEDLDLALLVRGALGLARRMISGSGRLSVVLLLLEVLHIEHFSEGREHLVERLLGQLDLGILAAGLQDLVEHLVNLVLHALGQAESRVGVNELGSDGLGFLNSVLNLHFWLS